MKAIICDKCGKVVRERFAFQNLLNCGSQIHSSYEDNIVFDLCEDCFLEIYNLATEYRSKDSCEDYSSKMNSFSTEDKRKM